MLAEITTEEKAHVDTIVGRHDHADGGLHRTWREKWSHYDGLYNNYDRFKNHWRDTSPRDLDAARRDARDEFGHELFIPHTFATVELVVARTLATPPRMIFKPKQPGSAKWARNVKELIASQASEIDYENIVQQVGKSGQIRNIGIQKTWWKEESRQTSRLEWIAGRPIRTKPESAVVFNGPVAEYVSPYDWIWDPFATELAQVGWCIHRTWRTDSYVLQKLGLLDGMDPVENAEWKLLAGRVEKEDVENAGSRGKFGEIMGGRIEAQGLRNPANPEQGSAKGENIHEVWEYHDAATREVTIILNRELPAARADFQNWRGDLPFQIYRPVWVPDQLVGKGAVEPIEELQHETNMLRSNRMWNMLLKLHAAYAYNDGFVDPDDVRIGPGALVGVNGDPSSMLMELMPGDIPASSYQEEDRQLADFFRTSGLGDPTEAQAGGETATGVQLVQQATQARVKVTTDRAKYEVVKPTARAWLQMNRQRVLRDPLEVRVPAGATPTDPYREYDWLKVPPEALGCDWDIQVEAGLEAENIAQNRQDGQTLMGLASDPRIDGQRLLPEALEKLGLHDPERYIAQHDPGVDPQLVYKTMIDGGVPPLIAESIMRGIMGEGGEQEGQEAGE